MRALRANVPAAGWCEIRIENRAVVGCGTLGPIRDNEPYCWRGFVDLQVNGFAGVDFGTDAPDAERFASVLEPIFSTGVTSFCPTVVTNDLKTQIAQLQILEEARVRYPLFDRAVPGYHLEGPWLSPKSSHGAHDPGRMRAPDWKDFEQLQSAACGRIRIVTIAPELTGATEFIRRARSQGITIAIGHTDGTLDDVYRATAAGASLSTHLGNGCPQALDRHQAPFWAQLADDRLKACIICDNFHVVPEVIKIISRVKGPSNCCLVTDAMQAAMMPPGPYKIANTMAELLPSGQVVRADRQSMAGSALTMDRAVANFRGATSCLLVEALRAASTNPANAIGSHPNSETIVPGEPADLILFELGEKDLRVHETILGGQCVWRA